MKNRAYNLIFYYLVSILITFQSYFFYIVYKLTGLKTALYGAYFGFATGIITLIFCIYLSYTLYRAYKFAHAF